MRVAPGEGDVRVWAQYDRDFHEEADAVVVGSGPAGAVAAYELVRSGLRVVLVEEGPPFTPADFELDGALSMARTMREGGLRATRGTVMPTMQAICLGGGSLVNSAICVRAPEFVLERWSSDFELAHTRRADLDPHYDAVGAFRTLDAGRPVDASASMPDGTQFEGLGGLQQILLDRKDEFTRAFTERLLTYALGRGLESYDQPKVRAIARSTASNDYRIRALILGIVRSEPFNMRRTPQA